MYIQYIHKKLGKNLILNPCHRSLRETNNMNTF